MTVLAERLRKAARFCGAGAVIACCGAANASPMIIDDIFSDAFVDRYVEFIGDASITRETDGSTLLRFTGPDDAIRVGGGLFQSYQIDLDFNSLTSGKLFR
jgi:hypothetical protein